MGFGILGFSRVVCCMAFCSTTAIAHITFYMIHVARGEGLGWVSRGKLSAPELLFLLLSSCN